MAHIERYSIKPVMATRGEGFEIIDNKDSGRMVAWARELAVAEIIEESLNERSSVLI